MTEPQEWYYNTVTGEVELGPQSPMQNRLGPYATREDAEIAKKRNKKWEDQDRDWNNWGTDKK